MQQLTRCSAALMQGSSLSMSLHEKPVREEEDHVQAGRGEVAAKSRLEERPGHEMAGPQRTSEVKDGGKEDAARILSALQKSGDFCCSAFAEGYSGRIVAFTCGICV